jgi:hypothetical protein
MKRAILFLLIFVAIGINAEKRIYFTYAYARLNPLPVETGLTTVDYRIGPSGTLFKMNNWDNMSGPWSPTSGSYTFSGTMRYHQYGFATTKTTFSVIHAVVANTTTPLTADLSQVTKDWTFHIAIKTNYVGKLDLTFQNKNGTQFTIDITNEVPNRNGTWNKVEISMDDFITATGIDFKDCVYTSTETTGSKRDMWIVKASEVSVAGDIGWDDCYLTDNNSLTTSVINVAENSKISINGNYLNLTSSINEGINVYNSTGAIVLKTKENSLDVSGLKSGVYFAKSNGQTLKFVR